MKISQTVTDVWGVQHFFENNQRGITCKLRKGDQPFLSWTYWLYPIHIPIQLHEDIMNSG